jgi:hypothetical protein
MLDVPLTAGTTDADPPAQPSLSTVEEAASRALSAHAPRPVAPAEVAAAVTWAGSSLRCW